MSALRKYALCATLWFANAAIAQDATGTEEHDPHAHHAVTEDATALAPEEQETVGDHDAMGHGAMDHGVTDDAPASRVEPEPKAEPDETDHAGMGHGPAEATPVQSTEPDHSSMDHGAMDHAPVEAAEPDHATMDHGTLDHSAMDPAPIEAAEPDHRTMDHIAMDHAPAEATEPDHGSMDHGSMDHSAMDHGETARKTPATPIPAVTDADRAAAVRPSGGHAAHDNGVFQYVLFDRLEVGRDEGASSTAWEVSAWRGTDLNRVWLRSEGERAAGDTETANIELLYGRSVTPWWDVVAGVRHDFGVGPSQTFAAFGVQGLAPYKIEVEATAYVGQAGQTALRVEAEYDTLLTNRLILQWVAEAEAYGKDDAQRGIGSGLNTVELGARLRYEIRREIAPYIGVSWERAFGDAADYRSDDGHDADDARFVAGIRIWF